MIDDRKYRDHYLKVERTAEQRRRDLTIAFDQIYELKRDRRNLKNWLKLLGLVVSIQGVVLGWFATHLLDCLEAGRRAAALLR